ncbi:MAG: hypothetical protein B7Z55_10155, partial [Planctomycetales bacterium 12-60-4]
MSFGFNTVAEYLASGIVLALIFYILRGAIDRRKGAMLEVAAVTFPIAVAAGILKVALPDQALITFGNLLSLVVQVVFVALPVFVAARLIERRRMGEQLQLADLFRITTVTSLVAFVFSSLAVSDSGFLLVICLCTFIVSDWVGDSRARNSNLAVVFISGFMALTLLDIAFRVRLTLVQQPKNWTLLSPAAISESAAMIALVLPQTLISIVMDTILQRSTLFPKFAVHLARWRQSIGRAEDLIYFRTVFDLWRFSRNVVYLNHGSFGAVPIVLQHRQSQIRQTCECEPMDFLTRKLEPQWFDAR